MDIDLKKDPSTIRMETGEIIETFFVLRRLKGMTSRKKFDIANHEMINGTILLSADLKNDQQPVPHPPKKNFQKTINRRHLMWFVSRQPKMPLLNYQTSVR